MRPPPFSETDLRAAISDALCWSDVLRNLGRRVAGGNHRTAQKYAKLWDISTSHFDPYARIRRGADTRRTPLDEVLREHSNYSRGFLKKRLYAEGLKERVCELCGQDESWHGRKMSLILDHINGVGDDHRLENLQIVCPNCAATLDTHCGRNQATDRERDCLSCKGPFQPSYPQHRYCSPSCANRAKAEAQAGIAKPDLRKVERPPLEQLLAEIEATSYVAVGRKYGVSDNAVRKWVAFEQQSPLNGGTR